MKVEYEHLRHGKDRCYLSYFQEIQISRYSFEDLIHKDYKNSGNIPNDSYVNHQLFLKFSNRDVPQSIGLWHAILTDQWAKSALYPPSAVPTI